MTMVDMQRGTTSKQPHDAFRSVQYEPTATEGPQGCFPCNSICRRLKIAKSALLHPNSSYVDAKEKLQARDHQIQQLKQHLQSLLQHADQPIAASSTATKHRALQSPPQLQVQQHAVQQQQQFDWEEQKAMRLPVEQEVYQLTQQLEGLHKVHEADKLHSEGTHAQALTETTHHHQQQMHQLQQQVDSLNSEQAQALHQLSVHHGTLLAAQETQHSAAVQGYEAAVADAEANAQRTVDEYAARVRRDQQQHAADIEQAVKSAMLDHKQAVQLQHDKRVAEHRAQMEALCAQHTAELNRVQQQSSKAVEEAAAGSEADKERLIVRHSQLLQQEMSSMRAEAKAQQLMCVNRVAASHKSRLEALHAEHTAEMNRMQQQCSRTVQEGAAKSDAALNRLLAKQDQLLKQQADKLSAQVEAVLVSKQAEHTAEVNGMRQQSRTALEEAASKSKSDLDRLSAQHAQLLKQQAESMRAEAEAALTSCQQQHKVNKAAGAKELESAVSSTKVEYESVMTAQTAAHMEEVAGLTRALSEAEQQAGSLRMELSHVQKQLHKADSKVIGKTAMQQQLGKLETANKLGKDRLGQALQELSCEKAARGADDRAAQKVKTQLDGLKSELSSVKSGRSKVEKQLQSQRRSSSQVSAELVQSQETIKAWRQSNEKDRKQLRRLTQEVQDLTADNKSYRQVQLNLQETVAFLGAQLQRQVSAGSSSSSSGGPGRPLVDTKIDIAEWLQQWAGNEKLYPKWSQLPQLMPNYTHARKVAGDGNCLFRAVLVLLLDAATADPGFAAALLEWILNLTTELQWVLNLKPHRNSGYSSVQQGAEILMDMLLDQSRLSDTSIHCVCNDQQQSDSLVLLLRAAAVQGMLTSEELDQEMVFTTSMTDLDLSRSGSVPSNLQEYCVEYVLPLAGPPEQDNFNARQGDQSHLFALSHILPATLKCVWTLGLKGPKEEMFGEDSQKKILTVALESEHYSALYS